MLDRRHWQRLPSMALVGLVAGSLLLACNGDDSAGDTATATSTTTIEATSTAGANDSDDFAARSPESLDSYRYEVTVSLAAAALDTSQAPAGLPLDGDFRIEMTGEVVNPGRERSETSIDLGFLAIATETIRIDGREWTRQAGGTWELGSSAGGTDALIGTNFSPASIFTTDADFSYDDLTARLGGHSWLDEEVEGVPARHYSFTQEEFYEVFATDQRVLPDDIDATFVTDIWISKEFGIPVRMVIVGTATDGAEVMRLEMLLTDLNDEISIEAPI